MNETLAEAIADLLACPCGGALQIDGEAVLCQTCARRYEVRDGMLDFLGDRASDPGSDREEP